jgi:hypothetical protein
MFERFDSYAFIHHRALNDYGALGEARALAARFPDRVHVLEGDICWDFSDGREELYFRHPSWIIDTLPAANIGALRRAGSLVMLEDLLELTQDQLFFVIELKVGTGDWRKALSRIVTFMMENFPQRFWIDGFSLTLLRHVRQLAPTITLTLHTEYVRNGLVLVAAPEWPPVRIKRLADLTWIDGVAVRWRFGTAYMHRAAQHVLAAGKSLLISRIHHPGQYFLSRKWAASGGYVHGDLEQIFSLDPEGDADSEVARRAFSVATGSAIRSR